MMWIFSVLVAMVPGVAFAASGVATQDTVTTDATTGTAKVRSKNIVRLMTDATSGTAEECPTLYVLHDLEVTDVEYLAAAAASAVKFVRKPYYHGNCYIDSFEQFTSTTTSSCDGDVVLGGVNPQWNECLVTALRTEKKLRPVNEPMVENINCSQVWLKLNALAKPPGCKKPVTSSLLMEEATVATDGKTNGGGSTVSNQEDEKDHRATSDTAAGKATVATDGKTNGGGSAEAAEEEGQEDEQCDGEGAEKGQAPP